MAESLKQIGCQYCIIGHSEVQTEYHESIDTIAKEATTLLDHGIIPIICVGETAQDYEIDRGVQAIEEQLCPVFSAISKKERNGYQLAVAYEPLWTISSGSIPTPEYLKQQITLIQQLAAQIVPQYTCSILYGGSVDEVTIGAFNHFAESRWRLNWKSKYGFSNASKNSIIIINVIKVTN